MSRLEKIVKDVVEGYRIVFFVMSVMILSLQGSLLSALLTVPILGFVYIIGLWLIAKVLVVALPIDILEQEYIEPRLEKLIEKLNRGEISADDPHLANEMATLELLKGSRIQEINRRLDAGELEADTPELEAEMIAAGLKPLAVVVEHGPVLGKQFDVQFYDYVMAREGINGEVHRYDYIGPTHFDEDGTITNVPSNENLYISIDGNLYEHVLEVAAESADPV